MSYFLTEEQQLIKNSVRDFVENEVKPRAIEIDKTGEYPMDLWKRCSELGFTGVCIPEKHGGLGADVTSEMVIMEELGRQSPTLALNVDAHMYAVATIEALGTEEQKMKYVVTCAKGESICALSTTEAEGSSNYSEWSFSVKDNGDSVVLNGTKIFTTNAHVADVYVVQTVTPQGLKQYIVEKGTPGLETGHIEKKLGLSGSNSGTVNFKNVVVPKANEIISGDAPSLLVPFLDVASISLGISEEVYERTFKYLMQRTRAGKPIATIGAIPAQLAQMSAKIEFARNFIYNAARLFDEGRPDPKLSFMAKASITEMAVEIVSRCMELHGATGYSEETGLARYLRDAQGFLVAEASTNIHWYLAAMMLGIPMNY
jgi:alkylation response protein AidB-like acyl-CoA dehydrogenase